MGELSNLFERANVAVNNYLHAELIRIFKDGNGFQHMIDKHINIPRSTLEKRARYNGHDATSFAGSREDVLEYLVSKLEDIELEIAFYAIARKGSEFYIFIDNPFQSYGYTVKQTARGELAYTEELPNIVFCFRLHPNRNVPILTTVFPCTDREMQVREGRNPSF